MRRTLLLLSTAFVFSMCDSRTEKTESTEQQKDPLEVQPTTEAITDSTKIVNDSVIMPETAPQ